MHASLQLRAPFGEDANDIPLETLGLNMKKDLWHIVALEDDPNVRRLTSHAKAASDAAPGWERARESMPIRGTGFEAAAAGASRFGGYQQLAE